MRWLREAATQSKDAKLFGAARTSIRPVRNPVYAFVVAFVGTVHGSSLHFSPTVYRRFENRRYGRSCLQREKFRL
jgi:hypothetical protein